MEVKVFGEKVEGVEYKTRVGVHVVIPRNENSEIVLIQAPTGAYFLPGGEIEAHETHEDAIKRELIEEVGFTCEISKYYGVADEYYYSRNRDTHFYNPAHMYGAKSFTVVGEPTETTNVVEWFPVDVAIEKLKRGSHKWGVEMWRESL
jgi:8-oxo-dGTP diphosphatase